MGGAGSPTNPGVITLSAGHSGALTGTVANYPNGSITGYQSSISSFCAPVVFGCTDSGACNYNAAANVNQGCDYSCVGCMDVTAANYNPNATIQGPQSCVYCDGGSFVMQIEMTDANGGGWGATQYFLSSIGTGTVYSGDFQTANVLTGAIATDLLCLPLGCYTFTVAGGTRWSISLEQNTSQAAAHRINLPSTSVLREGALLRAARIRSVSTSTCLLQLTTGHAFAHRQTRTSRPQRQYTVVRW